MDHPKVVTLTCNPTIDVSSEAEQVRPTHKTRTFRERIDPGGGGVNVARVLQRFGTPVEAIFLAGGVSGRVLDDLLARLELPWQCWPIAGETRMSHTVFERASGCEYRFVPEGPELSEAEWRPMLDAASAAPADYLVASGSLPRGVPNDFYARLCRARQGGRFVLDASGPELTEAMAAGGIFLAKPSRNELEEIAGKPLGSPEAIAAEASVHIRSGRVDYLAVTLGRDGAILVTGDGAFFLPVPPVETRSSVGAGDSFLAGMIHGLAEGMAISEAFRLAVAAGAATALTPGTDLCHPQDIRRLLGSVPEPQPLSRS